VTPPLALVRRPGPKLDHGIVTHLERVPVDLALAGRQWEAYVAAMASAGWTIAEVEPADKCPDAVFVEDALVVFDDLALITRPGDGRRREEVAGAERAARRLDLEIAFIDAPATLDGGDVLKVGRNVFVGVSARTDRAAVDQLAEIVSARGWTVRPVPVRRVLHLKSAVTALPDGTVIGHPQLVDDVSSFERFLPVPEPAGAHVVLLGHDRLLMASSAPRSAEIFETLGYHPIAVDISEFEKLEGCVTCLSVRVRCGFAASSR
jgi:dimethylargininase